MEHGAAASADVTVLFITNKPFDIHYRSEPVSRPAAQTASAQSPTSGLEPAAPPPNTRRN